MSESWKDFRDSDKYLSISEAAREGYMSRQALHDAVKKDELTLYQIGSNKRAELEAYLTPRPANKE